MSLTTNTVRKNDIRNFLNAKPGISDMELPANTVLVAEGEISIAQMSALAASQHELVPAPGPGLTLEFLGGTIKTGATAFDDAASDGNLVIHYENASGVAASSALEADGLVDVANQVGVFQRVTCLPTANKALVLDNNNAEFTTSSSAGSVCTYSIQYRIIS